MNKKYGQLGQYFVLLMRLGFIMIISIMVFFFLGFYLEKHFPSKGLILILFTLLGVAAGFYLLFKEINKALDKESRND